MNQQEQQIERSAAKCWPGTFQFSMRRLFGGTTMCAVVFALAFSDWIVGQSLWYGPLTLAHYGEPLGRVIAVVLLAPFAMYVMKPHPGIALLCVPAFFFWCLFGALGMSIGC